MSKLIAAFLIVVAGCATEVPSPAVQPTSTSSSRTPSPSVGVGPSPSALAALSPCGRDQVRVTPGAQGPAAGTNYLTVFVELAKGPACAISWSPMIEVRAADGTEIARATETDERPVALTYITRYYIAWSGDCGPISSGRLGAHIEFSPTLDVDLSIGKFRPSCVDGSGQSLSMYADEPAS
jgi:hypothetical protein